ncbi:WhiB family transcriptional regulator [Streptomyces sp. WAC 04229]|uniref:WhiB family transcriptional regulator n=1 Tax=Streptomyces sp. WAC 04229 TaxID=2203206 RepID=UPI00163B949E|nr:WhiB family transcriptional regulator [Streptomyces sp. WAC 04229]
MERGRAAGNTSLSLDAWHGDDRDGSEPQRVREARQAAAVEVCLNCPVMVACDSYANSVVREAGTPRLAEPDGIWGGRTALERHRAFIKRQHELVAAPDRLLQTPQKRALLRALAQFWRPVEVAEAAGLPDVRTANWQRSQVTRLLGLPKSVSRMRVLEAARERGLLDGVTVVPDDGSVPAVPVGVEDVLLEVGGQLLLWPTKRSEFRRRSGRRVGRGFRRRPLRARFVSVAGQVDLDVAELDGLADVRDLFPSEPMEAAA